ncbi:hypothetical protein CHUAL_004402 [Chamberlinius hualienensis]
MDYPENFAEVIYRRRSSILKLPNHDRTEHNIEESRRSLRRVSFNDEVRQCIYSATSSVHDFKCRSDENLPSVAPNNELLDAQPNNPKAVSWFKPPVDVQMPILEKQNEQQQTSQLIRTRSQFDHSLKPLNDNVKESIFSRTVFFDSNEANMEFSLNSTELPEKSFYCNDDMSISVTAEITADFSQSLADKENLTHQSKEKSLVQMIPNSDVSVAEDIILASHKTNATTLSKTSYNITRGNQNDSPSEFASNHEVLQTNYANQIQEEANEIQLSTKRDTDETDFTDKLTNVGEQSPGLHRQAIGEPKFAETKNDVFGSSLTNVEKSTVNPEITDMELENVMELHSINIQTIKMMEPDCISEPQTVKSSAQLLERRSQAITAEFKTTDNGVTDVDLKSEIIEVNSILVDVEQQPFAVQSPIGEMELTNFDMEITNAETDHDDKRETQSVEIQSKVLEVEAGYLSMELTNVEMESETATFYVEHEAASSENARELKPLELENENAEVENYEMQHDGIASEARKVVDEIAAANSIFEGIKVSQLLAAPVPDFLKRNDENTLPEVLFNRIEHLAHTSAALSAPAPEFLKKSDEISLPAVVDAFLPNVTVNAEIVADEKFENLMDISLPEYSIDSLTISSHSKFLEESTIKNVTSKVHNDNELNTDLDANDRRKTFTIIDKKTTADIDAQDRRKTFTLIDKKPTADIDAQDRRKTFVVVNKENSDGKDVTESLKICDSELSFSVEKTASEDETKKIRKADAILRDNRRLSYILAEINKMKERSFTTDSSSNNDKQESVAVEENDKSNRNIEELNVINQIIPQATEMHEVVVTEQQNAVKEPEKIKSFKKCNKPIELSDEHVVPVKRARADNLKATPVKVVVPTKIPVPQFVTRSHEQRCRDLYSSTQSDRLKSKVSSRLRPRNKDYLLTPAGTINSTASTINSTTSTINSTGTSGLDMTTQIMIEPLSMVNEVSDVNVVQQPTEVFNEGVENQSDETVEEELDKFHSLAKEQSQQHFETETAPQPMETVDHLRQPDEDIQTLRESPDVQQKVLESVTVVEETRESPEVQQKVLESVTVVEESRESYEAEQNVLASATVVKESGAIRKGKRPAKAKKNKHVAEKKNKPVAEKKNTPVAEKKNTTKTNESNPRKRSSPDSERGISESVTQAKIAKVLMLKEKLFGPDLQKNEIEEREEFLKNLRMRVETRKKNFNDCTRMIAALDEMETKVRKYIEEVNADSDNLEIKFLRRLMASPNNENLKQFMVKTWSHKKILVSVWNSFLTIEAEIGERIAKPESGPWNSMENRTVLSLRKMFSSQSAKDNEMLKHAHQMLWIAVEEMNHLFDACKTIHDLLEVLSILGENVTRAKSLHRDFEWVKSDHVLAVSGDRAVVEFIDKVASSKFSLSIDISLSNYSNRGCRVAKEDTFQSVTVSGDVRELDILSRTNSVSKGLGYLMFVVASVDDWLFIKTLKKLEIH